MTVLRVKLIGRNINQSRFSAALDLLCAQHGLTLEFQLIDTAGRTDFDFAAQVAACRDAGWNGVAVTHPFKPDAATLAGADASSDVARLGACNTLIFKPAPGARNTDYSGFIGAWSHVFGDRSPGHVAIAGAGGVARAIAPALVQLGAKRLSVWDQDADLARDLAARIGDSAQAIAPGQVADVIRDADGLVNATPLGMSQYPGSAFDPALIGPQDWAFDAVYTPINTLFLARARARGLAILSGFDLFRFMAIGSFTAFSGQAPDVTTALAALDSLREQVAAA